MALYIPPLNKPGVILAGDMLTAVEARRPALGGLLQSKVNTMKEKG